MPSRRSIRIITFTAILLTAIARRSSAQVATSYGGPVALGAALGGALPVGDRLENGLYAGGALLMSLGSHAALGAEIGANRVDIDRRPGFRTQLMPRFADLNLSVHWKHGPFRPFVTGGVGIYRYTIEISNDAFADPALRSALLGLGFSPTGTGGPVETRHDERGANLGGGFEYFFTHRGAVTMDVRGHVMKDFIQVVPFNGDFIVASVGFRQYF